MTDTPQTPGESGHDPYGDDVYQPDSAEDQEWVAQPDDEENLTDEKVSDPLDVGLSPPERPLGVEHTGTTAEEQHEGETLDQRLAEEVPDIPVPQGDGIGDQVGTDGEPLDDEVGGARAGRLKGTDEGLRHVDDDVQASDVGVNGAAASAEEAAVHVVGDEEE